MSLLDFDYDVTFAGAKSSEGDGRTAADIEREGAACPDCDCLEQANTEETD